MGRCVCPGPRGTEDVRRGGVERAKGTERVIQRTDKRQGCRGVELTNDAKLLYFCDFFDFTT